MFQRLREYFIKRQLHYDDAMFARGFGWAMYARYYQTHSLHEIHQDMIYPPVTPPWSFTQGARFAYERMLEWEEQK